MGSWGSSQIVEDHKEDITYDGNGNILTYKRNGARDTSLAMDDLSYAYPRDDVGNLSLNRLRHIRDAVAPDVYQSDVDNMADDNYLYDDLGNLLSDKSAHISNIVWSVYGKIRQITFSDGSSLSYKYDGSGNRVYKEYFQGGVSTKTWYVRDPHGNPLAVYGSINGVSVYWREQHLYGSTRLGMWLPNMVVSGGTIGNASSLWSQFNLTRYELSNHLGNVVATISDARQGKAATVYNENDYAPFGMQLPGRQFNLRDDTTSSPTSPAPIVGSPSQPVALYLHDFEASPYSKPYAGLPATHAYISNSSWTNDRTGDTAWVTYAGVSNGGHALALSSSAPETSTLTLTFDVDPGYRMNVNSFSFYNRSSYTGYQNWSMTINGIPVSPSPTSGADTIYVDVSGGSHVMRSTGTLPVASPVIGLEGKVTIELILSNRTGNQGTFRIDNFVLNGSIESVGGDVYTSVGGRYRYGFNGKENDNEVKGEGNQQDYGMRIYDPRLGRFLSVDPLTQHFPWYTPYQFAGNKPIWGY
ncbi:RHS repeat-associated core domain-containing protein [Chitinophaga sp. 30R24]|uniref:RHS repeat-associated core domain-containing protein n=1 Tax=Chitinophaga sp. 30R24 TaxID=3248838 RepID=UPI003B8F4D7B